MDPITFESLLPSFETFVKEFSIDPSVAFHLWRPILTEKIKRHNRDSTIEEQKKKLLKGLGKDNEQSSTDVETENIPEIGVHPAEAALGTNNSIENVMSASAAPPGPEMFFPATFHTNVSRPWHPALVAFIDEASHVLPPNVWSYMRYSLDKAY